MEKDNDPTVVLLGDSHGLHLYKGLKDVLVNESLALVGFWFGEGNYR